MILIKGGKSKINKIRQQKSLKYRKKELQIFKTKYNHYMTFFEKADILPPLSIFNKGYLSHIIIIYFNLITNINKINNLDKDKPLCIWMS